MTFKTGESGNPKGRSKGTGHKQRLFNDLVSPHQEDLFTKAIELALDGNEAMLRLFLERLLPAKPQDNAIELNFVSSDISNTNFVLEYGIQILNSLANGQLTPQQAKIIMSSMEIQRKNIETADLVARLEAVEKVLQQRK